MVGKTRWGEQCWLDEPGLTRTAKPTRHSFFQASTNSHLDVGNRRVGDVAAAWQWCRSLQERAKSLSGQLAGV